MVAEIGGSLVADFFGSGLAAVLGYARVVVDAHLADMQLGPTLRTLIETTQRQTQVGQRETTLPTTKIILHTPYFTLPNHIHASQAKSSNLPQPRTAASQARVEPTRATRRRETT